ncbi:nodulation protein NodF [Bradyrhizobium sp. 200]|uniref:nodulation protein NodF n=1 Tax=Bradyrhizobium sp. 200 TaxID=2782665 RepID=UPI001FFF34E9|nr:nodulation protein NodF [Bradyrhizobium sp. 200]UPJ47699.1 nodulation protein NodF [Bradyrhizobium sp. 200]
MADQTREGTHRQNRGIPAGAGEKRSLRNLPCVAPVAELTNLIYDLEQSNGMQIEMNTDDAWSNLKHIDDTVEAVHGLLAKKA